VFLYTIAHHSTNTNCYVQLTAWLCVLGKLSSLTGLLFVDMVTVWSLSAIRALMYVPALPAAAAAPVRLQYEEWVNAIIVDQIATVVVQSAVVHLNQMALQLGRSHEGTAHRLNLSL